VTPLRSALAAAGLALAMLLVRGSFAHNYDKGELHIRHPWTRAMSQGENVVPAYLEIRNTGAHPDRLIGASSPVAERVELMLVQEGVLVRKQEVLGLELPPRARLVLQPKASHLLFIGVARPLAKGERVPLALRFERAGELHVELEVQGLDSRKAHH
jgi:copper(I)-binding protein